MILLDLSKDLFEQLDRILGEKSVEKINEQLNKFWFVFTKADLVKIPVEKINKFIQLISSKYNNGNPIKSFIISTLKQVGIDELLKALEEEAPSSPHLYHDEDISNKNERIFCN